LKAAEAAGATRDAPNRTFALQAGDVVVGDFAVSFSAVSPPTFAILWPRGCYAVKSKYDCVFVQLYVLMLNLRKTKPIFCTLIFARNVAYVAASLILKRSR
jgi:hypothetical protein